MSDLELSENGPSYIEASDDDISVTKPTFNKTTIKLKSQEDELPDVDVDVDDDDDADADDEADDEGDDDVDDADDEDIDDDSDGDISIDPNGDMIEPKVIKKTTKSLANIDKLPETTIKIPSMIEKHESDYDSDSDEEEDEDYLQKFEKDIRENYIAEFHPESQGHNYDEIYNLAKVQRNKDNIIVDSLHKTVPILTKFEKTKILGIRAKQLNNGAKPMIALKNHVIDGYLIALKELEEKKIPVIIRRPLPNNTSEYWHLTDLEII